MLIKLLKTKTVITLIYAAISTSALADTDTKLEHFISLSLEDLVSLETTIATTSKHTASKAPAVVSLITSDDIKATGATNLVDILEGIPGIHVRASQFANRPLIHFRGASAKQTLLMINGNSMTDLVWGFGIFWKGVPASAIERIEIIRGPGSAVFGADASAGVINVITKTAGRIQYSEAGVRAGSFSSKTAWMQHGATINGYQLGFTAELFTTDGHDPLINADGQTRADTQTGTSISLAPANAHYGWRNEDIRFSLAKEYWRLQTDYTRRSEVEIGLTGFGVLEDTTRGEDSRFNMDLFYDNDNFSKHWSLNSELRYQHLDYTSNNGFQERPAGFIDPVTSDFYPDGQINQQSSAERRAVFKISTVYSGFENHALRIGTGYTWQDLYSVEHMVNYGTAADGSTITPGSPLINISDSPYAFAPEKTRKISHLFIEDVWNFSEDWELTAGARYDDYNDFGDTFNPRLALVWQTTSDLTSKLIYGQAFRAPNYQELFAITSFSLPNPDLDPERSETLDLAFSLKASSDVLLNMNLFYFSQTDLIGRDSSTQYQNLGDHRIRGLEFEAHWQTSKNLSLSGNFTVRNQDESNYRAIQEADEEAYFRTDWTFQPNWNWNIQANWIGERDRRSNDSRDAVDAHTITDTTLRYASSTNWEFAASIRNLFDEDAYEFTGGSIPNDLPLPERNAYAEMRYKF